jgi:diguanylate cyclase (GGDEF)-like protein/PAS domain S-box-containing protein
MSAEDEGGFQFLAENSIDVICRADMDMVLRYVSPSSFHVLGWKPEEMRGMRTVDFILPKDASLLPDSPISNPDEPVLPVRMRKKDGTLAWVEIRQRVVQDSNTNEASETIVVMRDITERKTLEEQLSVLEVTDSRTGLSTHRAFDEALEREWNRTLREGSYISLLLLDFDHFRKFHDRRLHWPGDRCVAKAAAAVIGAVRVTDIPAHYGAEDIAIILPATGSGGAARVAEKVRFAIHTLRSAPTGRDKSEGCVTVSIGIATVLARPGATTRMPEILLLGADSALRKAKGDKVVSSPRVGKTE